MLKSAYLVAKIGADTAENERSFAENLPKIGNYPTGAVLRAGLEATASSAGWRTAPAPLFAAATGGARSTTPTALAAALRGIGQT